MVINISVDIQTQNLFQSQLFDNSNLTASLQSQHFSSVGNRYCPFAASPKPFKKQLQHHICTHRFTSYGNTFFSPKILFPRYSSEPNETLYGHSRVNVSAPKRPV